MTAKKDHKTFIVDEKQRLDQFVSSRVEDLSRNRAQKIIEQGYVTVNDTYSLDKSFLLQEGDVVTFVIPPASEASVKPEEIQLDIVYEDKYLLVVNKPRGMVVHPAPGHSGGTLVNALLAWCEDLSGIGGVIRPGIVHRLDKDTSGLLIIAKNDFVHHALSEQLKSRKVEREYLALVRGRPPAKTGRIEAAIGRHPVDRKKMAVIARGRPAATKFYIVREYARYTLLRVALETGRTHQIRVHLAHLGIPVVGDLTYGVSEGNQLPECLNEPQALHAHRLTFIHPANGQRMEFSVPVPQKYRDLLHYLYRLNG